MIIISVFHCIGVFLSAIDRSVSGHGWSIAWGALISMIREGKDLGLESLSCPPDGGTGKSSMTDSQLSMMAESWPSTLVAGARTGPQAIDDRGSHTTSL